MDIPSSDTPSAGCCSPPPPQPCPPTAARRPPQPCPPPAAAAAAPNTVSCTLDAPAAAKTCVAGEARNLSPWAPLCLPHTGCSSRWSCTC
eukprot:1141271-Pelagomonas_calceolata.AAC.3